MTRRFRLIPNSLFGRAVLTLVVTFGLFAAMTFATIVQYALIPVANRSTQDLAAFMLLSSRTLVQLRAELRDSYREKLDQDYGLRLLEPPAAPQNLSSYYFPYVHRLELALTERLGHPVRMESNLVDDKRWFWVRLPTGDRGVWAGFPRDRIHTRPFEGIFVVLAISAILVFVTAALLARRVTKPLERLSRAAEQVARGISPTSLPETGPRELACLARQFNEMSRQVRELLGNRTVLLAGISHDLRTPLTRLRLALEMLPHDGRQGELVERMERDLDEMNDLIGQATELGKTLGAGEQRDLDLNELLTSLCADQPRVVWHPAAGCRHRGDPMAIRRIIGNLVENALRYSQGVVEVRLDCRHSPPVIFVLDRGPGIPEQEREAVFRPFYRLEQSRNRSTGGSGLGLAIARQLAIANGIEIRLGTRRGGGTVASVHLPEASGD
jgi:two-component system osmolarity sensor histidine kinase EnvZ